MINFKLKDVEIEGFRSFQGKQKFVLDREPGLYLISGENLHEPQLGSNGSGKSSLWDAVSWCLTGKTVRGIFGETVKNWESKTCTVKVNLTANDVDFTITRTHSPNLLSISPSIQIDGVEKEVITQDDLDRFLHLDHEKLIYALIVGQFNASFLDLLPTAKLNLFSNIMELDFWEKCSKDSSTFADSSQKECSILQNKRLVTQTKIEGLKAQEADLQPKEAAFEAERAAKIKELQAEEAEQVKRLAELEIDISKKAQAVGNVNANIDEQTSDLAAAVGYVKEAKTELPILQKQVAKLQAEKSELTKQFNKWKGLVDACPYCEQPIDIELAKTQKLTLTKKLLAHNKLIAREEDLVGTNQSRTLSLEEAQSEILASLDNLKTQRDKIAYELLNLKNSKENAGRTLDRVHSEIVMLKAGENPYTKLLIGCGLQREAADAVDAEDAKKLVEKEKELAGIQFWGKGFKELRLWLVSEALAALEVESNTAISQLGLHDWKLKFQMERETSKKTISKGFHVLVNSKTLHGDKYIPFETWSGGETQRLKLGSAIGFSSLIQNYKGIEFNVSFWDEPSSFLSEEGIEDLIKYLDEYAKSNGKVIYFADQRHLESPYFSGVIKVKKTDKGSRIYEN